MELSATAIFCVSINVRDAIEERNQQVTLMGKIYKIPSRVVVWVGESDSRIETDIQRLMKICGSLESMKIDDIVSTNSASEFKD